MKNQTRTAFYYLLFALEFCVTLQSSADIWGVKSGRNNPSRLFHFKEDGSSIVSVGTITNNGIPIIVDGLAIARDGGLFAFELGSNFSRLVSINQGTAVASPADQVLSSREIRGACVLNSGRLLALDSRNAQLITVNHQSGDQVGPAISLMLNDAPFLLSGECDVAQQADGTVYLTSSNSFYRVNVESGRLMLAHIDPAGGVNFSLWGAGLAFSKNSDSDNAFVLQTHNEDQIFTYHVANRFARTKIIDGFFFNAGPGDFAAQSSGISIAFGVSNVVLCLESYTKKSYQWERSPTLAAIDWIPIGPTIQGNGSRTCITDSNQEPQMFYRARGTQISTPLTNMVYIPSNSFLIGRSRAEAIPETTDYRDEVPQHLVTLTKSFWMGQFEVTQDDYITVMGNNPSFFNGIRADVDYGTNLKRPVDQVVRKGAMDYCELLTYREREKGNLGGDWEYRLPTEAEWEYACRAGTATATHYGNELLSGMANFNGQREYYSTNGLATNLNGIFLGSTTNVGSYSPNSWGLYDMHGNVAERCLDFGSPGIPSYSPDPVIDPWTSVNSGHGDIMRGGYWESDGRDCRSAARVERNTAVPGRDRGFRVILAPVHVGSTVGLGL
jgi:formylglycine-generating enzyme required for sulfatase activity